MTPEQKQRAMELITNKDHAIGLNMMKQLLQELIDEPEQAASVPPEGEKIVELDRNSHTSKPRQQRELVGKMEVGQLLGKRQDSCASNSGTERAVVLIAGIDEYGPLLKWYKHWVEFPIGTKLYTAAPKAPAVQNGYTPFYVYKLNYFDNGLDSIDDLPWEYCYSKDDLYRARMLVVPVKTRNNK